MLCELPVWQSAPPYATLLLRGNLILVLLSKVNPKEKTPVGRIDMKQP